MLKHLAAAGLLLSAMTLVPPADAASYGGASAPAMHAPSAMMMTKPTAMTAPAHRARTSKGLVWVDGRGFALYTFSKDAVGGRSACYGPCAVAWPPFYAPIGAHASGKWSVVHRMGFRSQWAYNGKPLYFWFKDTRPGQVTGDGVNGFHVAR